MITFKRAFAIAAVFGAATLAWLSFGGVMTARSFDQQHGLRGRVADLWGSPQSQVAPAFEFHWTTTRDVNKTVEEEGQVRHVTKRETVHHKELFGPQSTRAEVDLRLDERRKGLIWFALYDVNFDGAWRYRHRADRDGRLALRFRFPDPNGLYDDFRFVVDGVDRAGELTPADGVVTWWVDVRPQQEVSLQVAYRSRGLDEWRYQPSPDGGVASVEDFQLAMRTDFDAIDFPQPSLSPSSRRRDGDGWALDWTFARVVTGHGVGMTLPQRLQPGELAAALSFSAPVSLLFFFLVLFVLATLKGIDVHPVNYLLLASAFFAFHLLFGYLVDHTTVVTAFAAASVTSVVLVVSYLRLVVSSRFAFVEMAAAQLVYLVGFSLAHFWEGFTGLTVTVLSILTLFVVMQLTGRVRWSEVFGGAATAPPPLPSTR